MNRWLRVSVVVLLAFCIGVGPTSAREFQDDISVGMKLTGEEAEDLEGRLDRYPDDLQARSRLIVYYFGKSFVDEDARTAHIQHVLWLIRNAPQADLLGSPHSQIYPVFDLDSYSAGKQAWLSHIEREPTNVTFLGNAASFFWEPNDHQLVIETLQKAQSLDPDNSRWPTRLGRLHLRNAQHGEQLRNARQRPPEEPSSTVLALEQLQRAYELAGSDFERAHLQRSLATAAFEAERYDDAETYATAMLDNLHDGSNVGSQRHHANIVLGQLALVEDDVERAKYHLLEAAKISGSRPLSSFGPNMRLAADLLQRGEKDVVLAYFELCSNFWPKDKLKDWAALVEAGRTPDFGANLVY